MPNSTKSRTVRNSRRKASAETTTPTEETDMATDTATPETENTDALTFDFVVEEAPADYVPDRKNPGRTRKPSQFDAILENAFGKGWQRVPLQGDTDEAKEEFRKVVKRELTRAKAHLNVGLDINDTDTHVEFRSRELQKRARKEKGEATSADLPEQDGDNGDSDA